MPIAQTNLQVFKTAPDSSHFSGRAISHNFGDRGIRYFSLSRFSYLANCRRVSGFVVINAIETR